MGLKRHTFVSMAVAWLNFQIDLLLTIERTELLAENKKVKTKKTNRQTESVEKSVIVQAKFSHNGSGKNNQ